MFGRNTKNDLRIRRALFGEDMPIQSGPFELIIADQPEKGLIKRVEALEAQNQKLKGIIAELVDYVYGKKEE